MRCCRWLRPLRVEQTKTDYNTSPAAPLLDLPLILIIKLAKLFLDGFQKAISDCRQTEEKSDTRNLYEVGHSDSDPLIAGALVSSRNQSCDDESTLSTIMITAIPESRTGYYAVKLVRKNELALLN